MLEFFKWEKFKSFDLKTLFIKCESIKLQKDKASLDLEVWFAELKKWEIKHRNNVNDQLKGFYRNINLVPYVSTNHSLRNCFKY